jgi:hypothetical protein
VTQIQTESLPRQLFFALEFRGSASLTQGTNGTFRARTSAHSQALRTVLTAQGVEASVEAVDGESAAFESEVQMTGQGTFHEEGTITYGRLGKVAFTTVGQGIIGPSSLDNLQRGAIIWEIMGGEGQFAGATGLITSNFTLSPEGTVVDNHFARLFLPS